MSFLTRSDLVQAQRRDPHSARRPGAVRAGITGSGDSLLVLTWTAEELARERSAGTRLLRAAGIAPGMRVANTLPGALATPGSLQLGDVVDELGGLDVPLGSVDTDAAARQAWELVDRVEANVLVLDPRSGPRFLEAAPSSERPWWSGIVWAQTDSSPLPLPGVPRACGFGGRQRRWLAVPEVSSFAAMTCGADRFHLDSALHADLIEPRKGTPVDAGEPGLLALSWSTATPLYVTGIGCRSLTAACACGEPGLVLELA